MPPLHVVQGLRANNCRDCGKPLTDHSFDSEGFLFNYENWRRCYQEEV